MTENHHHPNAMQSLDRSTVVDRRPFAGRSATRRYRAAWPGALAAVAVVLLMACGGEDPAADAAPMDEPGAAAVDDTGAAPDGATADAPGDASADAGDAAGTAPAAAGTSKPAPKLTSLGGGTVAAGDLRDAYFHWKDETLTVVAYPASKHSTARWRTGMRFAGVAEEDAPQLLDCRFAEVPDGKIDITTPVVMRGTFSRRGTPGANGEPAQVVFEECEVVSTGGEMPADGDPWTLGADPIPVAALHEAILGWQGRTVQVEGWYKASGYSADRDVTEVNLAAETRGDMAVKCKVGGEIDTQAMADDREGVVVEGTIGEPGWSNLLLEDCRVLNRS